MIVYIQQIRVAGWIRVVLSWYCYTWVLALFFSQYLVQSNCSATKMSTRSQAARPPSQPALSTGTFEELMEISQVPHENQDTHCRVSLLEIQLSQLLNDNLALQEQCDALTARVKFLEDSMENNAASSNPKMVPSSSKCKKRRLDALSKAQSASRKKPAKSAAAHTNSSTIWL